MNVLLVALIFVAGSVAGATATWLLSNEVSLLQLAHFGDATAPIMALLTVAGAFWVVRYQDSIQQNELLRRRYDEYLVAVDAYLAELDKYHNYLLSDGPSQDRSHRKEKQKECEKSFQDVRRHHTLVALLDASNERTKIMLRISARIATLDPYVDTSDNQRKWAAVVLGWIDTITTAKLDLQASLTAKREEKSRVARSESDRFSAAIQKEAADVREEVGNQLSSRQRKAANL